MVRRSSAASSSTKVSSNSMEGNTSQEETPTSTNMDIDQDATTADKITGNSINSNRPKTLLSHPLLRPPCTTDIGYFQQQSNNNNDDDDESKKNDDDYDNYADVAVGPNESTMYPKSLVTGFYGSRRERVRHTVHEGALRLPRETFDVMSWKNPLSTVNYYSNTNPEEDTESLNLDNIVTTTPTNTVATATTATGNSKKKNKTGPKKTGATVSNPSPAPAVLYELPKLDSVLRPSLNLQRLGKIKVTYVSGQVVASGEGGTSSTFNPLIRSVARNQYITLPPETEIQRLRGGGGDDTADSNSKTNTKTNICNQPMTTPDNQQSSLIAGATTGNTTVSLNSAAAVVGSQTNYSITTSASSQGMTTSTIQPGVMTPTSLRTVNDPVIPPNIVSNAVASAGASNQPLYTTPVTSSNTVIMPTSTRAIAAPAASHSIQNQATNQPPITPSNMNVNTKIMVGINTAGASTNIAQGPLQSAVKQTMVPGTSASATSTASTSNNILPIVQNAQVIPLPSKPPSQWEQHAPNVTDEHHIDSMSKIPKPGWFQQNVPSDFEMTVLPEWFDSSAPHRTPELYIATRNNIISLSQKLGSNRYVTATMARRSIPGDVGSILRLHAFLTTYALINEDAINDTAPTPTLFRPQQQPQPSSTTTASSPNQRSSSADHEKLWASQSIRDLLVAAVVQQANSNTNTNSKKRNLDGTMSSGGGASSSTVPIIDWAAVAESIGQGVLPTDCERHFVSMSLETMSDGNNDNSDKQEGDEMVDVANVSSDNKDTNAFKLAVQRDFIKDLVSTCDPDVVRDVAVAALQSITSSSTTTATSTSKTDLTDAQTNLQKATSLGLLVHNIAQEAYNEEQNVARLLAELVTIRMQKLENRLSLLDDVEGLLEAERVSLELERRDLYTARCRHWFGGT